MKLWEVYHALGEPTRLRVVLTIIRSQQGGKPQGESVGDLCRMLDLSMVNMSHHLGVLRNAGVLESERHGRHIYYTIGSDFIVGTKAEGVALICDDVEMLLIVGERRA